MGSCISATNIPAADSRLEPSEMAQIQTADASPTTRSPTERSECFKNKPVVLMASNENLSKNDQGYRNVSTTDEGASTSSSTSAEPTKAPTNKRAVLAIATQKRLKIK